MSNLDTKRLHHLGIGMLEAHTRAAAISRAALARAIAFTKSASATTGATNPYEQFASVAIASGQGSLGSDIRQHLACMDVR